MGHYTQVTEAVFGSGSNLSELSHYRTSFIVGQDGLETTGSVCSGSVVVYEANGVNRTGGTVFMQIFDLTGSPGPDYRPVVSIPIPSASIVSYSFRTGLSLPLGLQLGWSTNYSSFTASVNAGAFYVEYKR